MIMAGTDYTDKGTIKLLAQRNWRGVGIATLVAQFQEARDAIETLTKWPNLCPEIIHRVPKDFPGTREEYITLRKYHYACVAGGILKEIKRRQSLDCNPRANTDKEIIEAIKDRVPVADVLEWYTDVFYASREQGKFRCTLHGEDKHPSGVIYTKEARWWCFGCSKGGDVFDAVQAFEKTDLPHAIAKLARYVGLDTKPLIRKPVPQVRGGALV